MQEVKHHCDPCPGIVCCMSPVCNLRQLHAQVFEYSEESKEQLEEAATGDGGIFQSILEVLGLSEGAKKSKVQ